MELEGGRIGNEYSQCTFIEAIRLQQGEDCYSGRKDSILFDSALHPDNILQLYTQLYRY